MDKACAHAVIKLIRRSGYGANRITTGSYIIIRSVYSACTGISRRKILKLICHAIRFIIIFDIIHKFQSVLRQRCGHNLVAAVHGRAQIH